MFNQLLVLCAGNLCRSPLAEALFRVRLAQVGKSVQVSSAGLIAGFRNPADTVTVAVAASHGLDLSAHESRPVDPGVIHWADLVLVMEQIQRRHLLALAPTTAGKVYLLGHWSGGDIPDPYGRGRDAGELAYRQIEAAVEAWLPRL